jgi:hypothetical protein
MAPFKGEKHMGCKFMTVTLSVLVLALTAKANEKAPDTYQKAMRDTAEAFQTVRAAAKEIEESDAGAQDYDPFVKATAAMKTSFATTLAFWQTQKADDAVTMSQEALKAVADLEAAAKERDYRLVRASFTKLGETCTGCHMAHRVRLSDGTYEIK